MKFLRNLLASILGGIVAFFIIILLFLVIVGSLKTDEVVTIKPNTVLQLKLDADLRDFAPKSDDPLDIILEINENKMGLNEVLNAIENAKYDSNIEGISIELNRFTGGLSQLQTIRKKIKEFKETGKFVTAYADVYSQSTYYLSSVADSVYVNPVGSVDFKGLATEVLFLKDFQDKTGVKFEVVRHGKYKSAVEPFLENEMSDDNREQTMVFLQSLWGTMLVEMGESRALEIDRLNVIADNLEGRNATGAIAAGLVDAELYIDEYREKIESILDTNKQRYVSVKDYINSGKGRVISTSRDKIAVIYAQGEIIYGEGNENYIGQDLIVKSLKKARNDNSIKGIVLRVNSPGGSALASELIWRELEITKKEKPLVVSMGDYAASGGYYLACNANYIYAEPTSITGSIGVFGTVLNLEEISSRFGINADQVRTNNNPYYSAFEPMSDGYRAVVKQGIEEIYTTFLNRVSEGRNMEVSAVNEIAQGRVWSGVDAVEIGLVDKLGTLEDAISHAAELAEITDFNVRSYPDYDRDLEKTLSGIPLISTKDEILKESIGNEGYELYSTLNSLQKQKGTQMRLPFIMTIK